MSFFHSYRPCSQFSTFIESVCFFFQETLALADNAFLWDTLSHCIWQFFKNRFTILQVRYGNGINDHIAINSTLRVWVIYWILDRRNVRCIWYKMRISSEFSNQMQFRYFPPNAITIFLPSKMEIIDEKSLNCEVRRIDW